MNDTNLISSIVKILETPNHDIIDRTIFMSTFRVQLPQTRKNTIIYLRVWGNLVHDVKKYYKVDDYILIEGYLSVGTKFNQTDSIRFQQNTKIEITLLKIYPLLF